MHSAPVHPVMAVDGIHNRKTVRNAAEPVINLVTDVTETELNFATNASEVDPLMLIAGTAVVQVLMEIILVQSVQEAGKFPKRA